MGNYDNLSRALAEMLPFEVSPRCPKDGGDLLYTATVYVHVPVKATVLMGSAHVEPTSRVRETKAQIAQDAAEEQLYDERDELHCATCDYWTTIAELERRLENA